MKDIPIILRGDLKATLVVKTSDLKENIFTVYHMLAKGKLLLKDDETTVGSKGIDVRKGDIICIWADRVTGYEEFCGWLNESGDILQKGDSTHTVPDRLHAMIRDRLASSEDPIT